MSSSQQPDKSAVLTVVSAALEDVLQQRGRAGATVDLDTRLVGGSAVLDSLGLVTLIVDLEQRLEETFGHSLTLANERAMSQANSPFLSVRSLTDYVHGLIVEAGAHA